MSTETVRAVVCSKLGDLRDAHGAPRLAVERVQLRQLQPNEVRVQVVASGFNFADVLQLQGRYQEKPSLPFVPGNELSGHVLEVGSAVKHLYPGDTICGITQGGAFAEQAVLSEASCLKLPQGVDLTRAAGIPIAFGTAHLSLAHRARLKPGQTVLVLGAAGGVGLAAVQLAKVMGARVVAVSRGAAKGQATFEMGADVCLDSGRPGFDLAAEVKKAAPKGIDVLFDTVGGRAFDAAVRCLRWGSQVLLIGFASGGIPKIAANIALVKNLTLHGVYWGMYLKNDPRTLRESLKQVLVWVAEEKLRVPIWKVHPLEDTDKAIATLFNREVIGKVILRPELPAAPRL